jgi:hypothetical protein
MARKRQISLQKVGLVRVFNTSEKNDIAAGRTSFLFSMAWPTVRMANELLTPNKEVLYELQSIAAVPPIKHPLYPQENFSSGFLENSVNQRARHGVAAVMV